MFNIQYDTWQKMCELIFSVKDRAKRTYLQWFPFSKLSKEERELIKSKEFFKKYIDNSSFVLFDEMLHQSENYIQKSDGSFRDSSLISPILYLVLQCIGKEIADKYKDSRGNNCLVFYAGNYRCDRVTYKNDYDAFYKAINESKENYNYFIKTDLSNFFSNINVDLLIARIDEVCNVSNTNFSQTTLQIYKSLLLYCGNGRFPLIENSVASSFLSTVIYLDIIDQRLANFINNKVSGIQNYKMIRYVDDLYIMFSSSEELDSLRPLYNEIKNEYSSILKEYGLSINTKKCCIKESREINDELKKSLYDEYFKGIKRNISDLFKGKMSEFLFRLRVELIQGTIDKEIYNTLIAEYFSSPDIEFIPQEVFNYYIYEDDTELSVNETQDIILDIINEDISFISLDPQRLTIMIMKTKSEVAIKAFLNKLFERYRSKKWNSYDTTIAISYLIQRNFKHKDLLTILEKTHPKLYSYYLINCKDSFLSSINDQYSEKLQEIVSNDWKTYYLYFMYLCEKERNNYLAAFAYYKNFFDRITAHFAYTYDNDGSKKRPNYNKYYKEEVIKKVYESISDSDTIIKKAHKIRNSNPLSHSSSESLDKYTTKDLLDNITELTQIIKTYIENKI